jgi:Protein of unknown function (DUF1236)
MAVALEVLMRKFVLASATFVALALAPSFGLAQAVVIEPEVETWVTEQSGPTVTIEKDVVVGDLLPDTVELVEVPKYKKYRYAIINKKRVLVDSDTRKVIKVY